MSVSATSPTKSPRRGGLRWTLTGIAALILIGAMVYDTRIVVIEIGRASCRERVLNLV